MQADSKQNAHKVEALESKSIDKNQAQALESTFEKVDSRVDCHAANAARNDRENNATNTKVDSSTAANASEPQKDSRISKETSPAASGIPCFLKKHRLTPSGIPCFLKGIVLRFACK